MEYKNYEKITDIIYSLDNITHITFTTKLYIKNNNSMYEPIHQEFNYNKTGFKGPIRMIKRKISFYMSIEKYKTNNTEKTSIVIKPSDFLMFRTFLNKVFEWYNSPEYNGLYTMVGDSLKKTMTIPPLQLELSYKNIIAFEPIVIADKYPGVRLYLNGDNNYTDIFINVFYGLLYIINGFDMVQYSATMLNYIQRPEYGYNSISYDDYNNTNLEVVSGTNGNKNKIPNENLSFFDKMARLNKNE